MTATITLNTENYGPTGFEVEIDQTGKVLKVASAAAQLPETVFRLTYGDRWEAAREYFQCLSENLTYRVEAAAWFNDVLPEYKLLRRGFRKSSAAANPATGNDAPLYARRAAFWLQNPAARPALFLQKRASSGFSAIADLLRDSKADAEALQPWLFSLIGLLKGVDDRRKVYELIGLLGTPEATEYLFSELERPGRHPYASGLLHSLWPLAIPKFTDRILSLHGTIGQDAGLVKDYLALLRPLRGEAVHKVAIKLLHLHPARAREVLETLKATDHPAPGAAIRARFDVEQNFFLLDLLAELIHDEPEGVHIRLREMNAKIDSEAFSKAAPVTWPQMLGPNWLILVLNAPEEELISVVSEYLQRPEPWLQRNALLQLKIWAGAKTTNLVLPDLIEQRLRELVASRHEKIYTVALDIISDIFDNLSDKPLMVDEVMAQSLTSSYRLMNKAILKKAAASPDLKQQQSLFFRSAFQRADSVETLKQMERIIPYLSFLDMQQQLKSAARRRQRDLLQGL